MLEGIIYREHDKKHFFFFFKRLQFALTQDKDLSEGFYKGHTVRKTAFPHAVVVLCEGTQQQRTIVCDGISSVTSQVNLKKKERLKHATLNSP